MTHTNNSRPPCEVCAADMTGKRSHARFCSRACKVRARQRRQVWRWMDEAPTTEQLLEHSWSPMEAAALLALPDDVEPEPLGDWSDFNGRGYQVNGRPPEIFGLGLTLAQAKAIWRVYTSTKQAPLALWKAGLLERGMGSNMAVYRLSERGREYLSRDCLRLKQLAGGFCLKQLWVPGRARGFVTWQEAAYWLKLQTDRGITGGYYELEY